MLNLGAFTQDAAAQILSQMGGIPITGSRWYVNKTSGSNTYDGSSSDSAFATIAQGISRAVGGDQIVIASGAYDEAITITKSGIALIGAGNIGQVSIAPSTSNATAVAISGTSSSRTQAVTLTNIGCEGNGTGGGLSATGNIRTVRALGCKIEGGAFGVTLESTAAGSVADTKILGCEICWTASGVKLLVSGGGDPVTQTLIQSCLLHNYTTDGVMNVTVHSADVWLLNNVFANQEDGTEPTQYIDLAVASTTGFCAGNFIANPTNASAQIAIAAGVIWGPNGTEAGWSTARPA